MTTDPGSGLPVSGPPPSDPGEAPFSDAPAFDRASAEAASSEAASSDSEASERLQAMLAQASAGQRDEQREITGALGEMRSQLQRLGQEIAELRATPSSDDGGTGINNVTVELREAVRFLSERFDGVTRMITQRGEELADIRTALTAIDAHVRSQAETIGVLSTGLQALPSYGERVSGLQEHIDAVHQRLGGLETAVARPADPGINNRLAAIEATLAPLGQQLAGGGQSAAAHGAALADATASVQELSAKVDALAAGTQAALATPAAFDDSALTSLDQRLAAVASDLTALGHLVSTQVAHVAASAADADPVITGDDLDRSMRETESRLRAHVDDAVMALAEALLRPRSISASSSSSVPMRQVAAPPVAAPAVSVPPVAAPSVAAPSVSVPTVSTSPVAPAPVALSADDDELGSPEPAAEPPTQWWERDEAVAAPASAPTASAPTASAPTANVPTIPALDEDAAAFDAGAVDFSQAEIADEDPDEAAISHFDLAPVEADHGVAAPTPVVPALPAMDAPSPAAPPLPPPAPPIDPMADTAAWSPEVPGSRPDPVDAPAGTVVPERKRRFFNR